MRCKKYNPATSERVLALVRGYAGKQNISFEYVGKDKTSEISKNQKNSILSLDEVNGIWALRINNAIREVGKKYSIGQAITDFIDA